MSDALSFVEIVGQHVELLPARTVLSMFSAGGSCSSCTGTTTGTTTTGTGTTTSTPGVTGGAAQASASHFSAEELIMIVNGGPAGTGGATQGASSPGGAGVVAH